MHSKFPIPNSKLHGADMTSDARLALRRAGLSRRRFLKGTGALIVGFSGARLTEIPASAIVQAPAGPQGGRSPSDRLDSWIAVGADGSLDYAQLDAQVRHIAARLAEQGLGERDIIAVRVPNGRRAVAAELAVAAIGAVALPYPPGHGSRGPVSLLSRSRASAIVVERGTDAKAAVPDAQLPYLQAVFSWGEPTHPAGVDLRRPARRPFTPRPVDAEAPARILVTSGSESEPKMIAYSHNAMGGGRANYVRALSCGHPGPVRNLVLAPLASSYGSLGTSVTVAALGGTLIVQDGYDAHAALRALTVHRPTHVFGVPTMLRRLAELPPPPGEDLSALRAVVSSCGALPPATAEVVTRRFRRLLDEAAKPVAERGSQGSPRRFAYPPNLLVIDGGGPQANAAADALTEMGITDVAVIGLAKRLEEVWVPSEPDPVIFPRNSEGLYLLQRVRDEAHRFAIGYSRARRARRTVTSQLLDIPGVGPQRRRLLLGRFGSLAGVRLATPQEIAALPGFSSRLADRVLEHLGNIEHRTSNIDHRTSVQDRRNDEVSEPSPGAGNRE